MELYYNEIRGHLVIVDSLNFLTPFKSSLVISFTPRTIGFLHVVSL
jgi:hypothetical protein